MSRSPLPPPVGEPPAKVVFRTDAPGADAQQLLSENGGAIKRFQAKARQSREISGNPTATMQGSLPGGGRVRSVYNNGQETLYVDLTPPLPGEIELPNPQLVIPPPPPLLCIDMIFTNQLFSVGAIYSFQSETIPGTPDAPPGTPAEDQPNFVKIADYPATDHSDYFNAEIESGGPFSVMYDRIGPLGDSWAAPNMTDPYPDPYAQITSFAASVFNAHVATGNDAQFIFVYEFQRGRHSGGFGGGGSAQYIYARELWQRTAPPGSPTPGRRNFLDRRDYYDILNVVGARVDPDNEPYEADSTGRTTDKRIQPLMQGAKVTVERNVTFAQGTSEKLLGHCFIAQPLQPIIPGIDPDEVVIDIYVETTNVMQRNTLQSAKAGSAFTVDDSGMTYTPWKPDRWEINVRELQGISPKLVQVNLHTEGRSIKTKSNVAPAPGQDPSQPVSTTIIPKAREQSWLFAAAPNWTDHGGPPADPHAVGQDGKPSMGNLLWIMADELGGGQIITQTDGPAGPPRKVFEFPEWSQGIDAMHKVATVKWRPSPDGIRPGKAKVTIY